MKEKMMRRKAHRNYRKSSISKVMTGLLIGGLVGAAVGWLTAPASGEEMRRRLQSNLVGYREKARSAMENVESRARELAAAAREPEQLP
jgi:gas vesicle protein